MPVGQLLLGYDGDQRHTDAPQHFPDRLVAGAVEGGIHHAKPRRAAHARIDLTGEDAGHVGLEQAVLDHDDPSAGQSFIKRNGFHVPEQVDLADIRRHLVRVVIGHLAAVGAVALVAVVFGGVVAGRDHDAGLAMVFPHRIGQHRRGLQLGEQMDGDAVGSEHPRRLPGEKIGFDPGIKRDGDGRLVVPVVQIIRQALGRLADGVDIHPVVSGSDDAPQAARAEFQLPVEAVLDRVLLPFDVLELPDKVGILRGVLEPKVVFPTNVSVHA